MASHEVDEIIDAEVPFSVVSLHATQARIVPDGFHNYFMRTALQSRGMVLLSRLQYCCNCIIIAIMRHIGLLMPKLNWTRHFPDTMGRSNAPSCRSQKVGISKCKSRADRSKPVGLLVRPPAAFSAMAARRFGAV